TYRRTVGRPTPGTSEGTSRGRTKTHPRLEWGLEHLPQGTEKHARRVGFSARICGVEPQPHLLRGLGTPVDARAVDLRVRGRPTTAVYRLVEAQSDLRAGGRTLGTRLGIYQLLQALPLGEWVCVDALTEREQRILPALPPWTRVRRNRHILRLADTPVRLDALLARGNTWKEALDRACALGRVAPSTAVCPPLGSDREQACWGRTSTVWDWRSTTASRSRCWCTLPPRSPNPWWP